jgi:hypothetical protein
MSYAYSAQDRLDDPSNYMYSPFGGVDFLRAYRQSRLDFLQRQVDRAAISQDAPLEAFALARWWQPVRSQLGLPEEAAYVSSTAAWTARKDQDAFHIDDDVETLALLGCLLTQDFDSSYLSAWVARIIQRFEVTKKLYACYPSGFRKGSGASDDLLLYRLFALLLVVRMVEKPHLVCLNALLKVNDLLISSVDRIPPSRASRAVLRLVVEAELVIVDGIRMEKGVALA